MNAIISSVLMLVAGLAFFLYGMHIMSESLEKMAGGKLEALLQKTAANPFLGVFLGAIITIAMQSSSACTVMLVGLVNSGLMGFAQTVYVIYGANIGTTLTAWILSLAGLENSPILQILKPANLAAIAALIGILLVMVSKKNTRRTVGVVLLGFALLMYGMSMMSDAVKPLTQLEGFDRALAYMENPIVGLLVAMLFTAVIQSSAGSIGILQALSMSGVVMSYKMVIPMVMGLNIGTCITSMIACIGANTNAKRVAGIHVAANFIGSIVFLPLYLILNATIQFPFSTMQAEPWGIAVVHSVFNILLTLLLLPLTKLLVRLMDLLIRDKKGAEAVEEPEFKLDENLLRRSPSVAISICSEQTVRMSSLAHDTLFSTFSVLYKYDPDVADHILVQEGKLDKMEDELGTYLVPIGSQALSSADSRLVASMLQNIGDFERLGDHAVNLLKVSQEMHEKKISFSERAKGELQVLMNATTEILNLTEQAFRERNLQLAARVEPLEQVIDNLIARIRSNHINRLCAGDCTIEMGFVLADLLNNFERISDHCSNIAVAIIELTHDSFDTHRYLNDIKTGNNEEFTRIYGEYVAQFAL